jgi:hypothetical protein
MFQNSEDCNLKNHITSSDGQFLAKGQSDAGLSVKDARRSSWLGELDQQWETDNQVKPTKDRYFLICRSCLWCASYFKDQIAFAQCPHCYDGKIECMPIGDDENYRFDYSNSKGIELKFSNTIRR